MRDATDRIVDQIVGNHVFIEPTLPNSRDELKRVLKLMEHANPHHVSMDFKRGGEPLNRFKNKIMAIFKKEDVNF